VKHVVTIKETGFIIIHFSLQADGTIMFFFKATYNYFFTEKGTKQSLQEIPMDNFTIQSN